MNSEKTLTFVFVACFLGLIIGIWLAFFGLGFGLLGAVLGFLLMFGSVGVALLVLFGAVVGQSRAAKKSASAIPIRFAAKVHSVWRTDKGKVIPPEAEFVERPQYHVVLISEEGKRFEVETSPVVFAECLEGSWGYATVQGTWLGSYQRDADLYAKHSARR